MSAEDDAPLRAAPSREESRRALGYVALFSLLTVVPGLSLLVRGSTRASGGARRSAEFASPALTAGRCCCWSARSTVRSYSE